jgi:hypothetical protein
MHSRARGRGRLSVREALRNSRARAGGEPRTWQP